MDLNPFGWEQILMSYGRALGWAVVAAVGFSIGIGLALKVFNALTGEINEWEEIKKGNIGVALILISLILVVGLLTYKVI